MNAQPICSENELRYRSVQNSDCKPASDPWNCSSAHEPIDDVDLSQDRSCSAADMSRLQDVKPIRVVDDTDAQTDASNIRQLILRFCRATANSRVGVKSEIR